MRTLTLYKCDDCDEEFVIGRRCSSHDSNVNMKHSTFHAIGTESVSVIRGHRDYSNPEDVEYRMSQPDMSWR